MKLEKIAFFVNKQKGTVTLPIADYLTLTDLEPENVPERVSRRFKRFSVSGSGHRLIATEDAQTKQLVIGIKGARNTLMLGSGINLRGTIAIQGRDLTVSIGAGTTFNNVEIYCKGKRNGVFIGRDCMFSAGIEIRTSDAHTIIDLDTMQRCNVADGVYIGDHVWVSKNAFVQKGTTVGSDNVIGYGSMVKGDLDITNAVIVGAPAKPLRDRRVTWSRQGDLKDVDVDRLKDWQSLPEL
ncbi:acyltransferase [Aliirhizobium smilacinae]|uniref:Acyltransferase n=1 Tax=Aliirhizobium smilacinae TaxID=1395944 RepID=A0A5C4XS78_9HYPH|nr:hypothetical protein [Rhizobium smilacinae]TNM66163.1 hypothetical protein FHP24_08120 [Rhizobium smilacinae]